MRRGVLAMQEISSQLALTARLTPFELSHNLYFRLTLPAETSILNL